MTIQLVETSEEDSFVAIVQHISNLLNDGQAKTALAETPGSQFYNECVGYVQDARFDEYLKQLIKHIDLIYSKSSDKDAECCLNIMVHAASRIPEETFLPTVDSFAKALAAKFDDRSEERLASLLNLYSMCSHAKAAYSVLLVVVDFARKTQKLAVGMAPAIKGKAEELVRDWSLTEEQSRNLYLGFAALFKVAGDKASFKEYMKLMLLALGTAQEGNTAATDVLQPHAAQLVADIIRHPDIFQVDIVELPAVSALEKSSTYAPTYRLLEALLSGDITAFRAAATPATLEAVGVSADNALTKARMMALLALGSRSTHEEVAFSDIQRALDISADQVEAWIVKAIGKKLIEGKIDQVRNVVVMSKCTQRVFGKNEWVQLRAQLTLWKSNLQEVSQTMSVHSVGLPAVRAVQAARA